MVSERRSGKRNGQIIQVEKGRRIKKATSERETQWEVQDEQK